MIDKLQLLVQANHGIILYPHWVNSSDFKNTPETFGTIALHDEELANELSKIEVGPDVKLTHDMKYLCQVMGTKLPLLPVHTVAERKLFYQIILKNIMDPRQQALEWVKGVNGVDIFPKLPVHLRDYCERFEQNARARQAYDDARESRESLDSLNKSLCPISTEPDDHTNPHAPDEDSNQQVPDEGSNRQELMRHPRQYTRQWEPAVAPQPLRPAAPNAIETRNISVGGMLIDKNPEVIQMDSIFINRNGKRGRDIQKRAIRRCMKCVEHGASDEVARVCRGRNNRNHCQHN